jgi:dihydropteroate synthase
MVGPSRKRFIRELTQPATGAGRAGPVYEHALDPGTVGAALAAAAAGAHLVRVHDVVGLRPALAVFEAVRGRER